jgi:peptide deformylase
MKTLWEKCEKDPDILHQRVAESSLKECNDAIKKIEEVLDSHDSTNCFGLAANQIGLKARVCLLRVPPHYLNKKGDKPVIFKFFNPEIVEWSGKSVNQEWCYSLSPTESYIVERHAQVTIKDDKNGLTKLGGVPGYAAQHEIDHLNGKLISDKGKPAMDFIMNVVGSPKAQPKNSLCKCGSGKKYKRCCGKNK